MRTRLPKWSSIIFRFKQFYLQKSNKFNLWKKKRRIENWLGELGNSNTKVFIGANFALKGGVRNHIVAIKKYSSLKIDLIPSDQMMERFNAWDFEKRFKDLFFKFKPKHGTVLHSHVYPWYIEWCRLKQTQGFYWVHTYHLPYFPEHANNEAMKKWQDDYNKALENEAKHADVKLSVAKWQREFLKKNNNIDTIYLPNGVDVELCDEGNDQIAFKKLGFKDYILNVSRHDPVKNPGEFVKLAISLPEYRFVMIGHGLSDELLKEEYQVDVPDNLLVMDGVSQKEIQHYIAACSVLVSTAKREGLPTLVLEGMAHSKPVVVSNEPGSMEAIDHGNYGYYYELGDIQDLKNKTLESLKDEEIGLEARKRVLEEYDWRVVSKKLDNIYNGN